MMQQKFRIGKSAGFARHLGKAVGASRKRNEKRQFHKQVRQATSKQMRCELEGCDNSE